MARKPRLRHQPREGLPRRLPGPASQPALAAGASLSACETLLLLRSSLQLPAALLSSACLARPPAALTWAPRGALPAKQWRPGRRDPRSGRGRTPAVERGAQAGRPRRAPGGCGDSTPRIPQGSKWALFQYW